MSIGGHLYGDPQGCSLAQRCGRVSERKGKRGHDRDVVASAPLPKLSRETLEARHVIARLDANADGAQAKLAADGPVAREVRFGTCPAIAVIVRATARAHSNERRQRNSAIAERELFRELRADVVREEVQVVVERDALVAARRQAEGRDEREVRANGISTLQSHRDGIAEQIAVVACRKVRAHERTRLEAWTWRLTVRVSAENRAEDGG